VTPPPDTRTARAGGKSLWLIAALVFLAIPILSYLWAIHEARSHTQAYVAEAYAKWGSSVEASALGPARIGLLLTVEDPTFYRHRVKAIEEFLAGKRVPASVLDVEYDGKRRGSIAEEVLMAFLRFVTV